MYEIEIKSLLGDAEAAETLAAKDEGIGFESAIFGHALAAQPLF